MIYLASPYSHADPTVREHRYREACRAVVNLLQNNQCVFSPVVHSHPLVAFGLPTDWTFWERVDREHLARCDEVLVLMLDRWETSHGVQAEIEIARELGKPVGYLLLENIGIDARLAEGTTEIAI